MTTPEPSAPSGADHPLSNFTECHGGILRKLQALDELSTLLGPAARARQLASDALAFFREAIFEHHLEEEHDLFPAVLASAEPGAEHDRVLSMVLRLSEQHRELENQWKQLERGLRQVARGQPTDLDSVLLQRLVHDYADHAAYEERHFLPLSETILGRNSNHMAALGLSLHMRHVKPVNAYI